MIDLSHWDFSRGDHTLALDGEWAFYWQELLEPADFPRPSSQPTFIQFPSPWNNHVVDGQTLGGDGYATYRLIIKLAPQALSQRYAFRLRNVSSAYSLWVNDKHITEVGKVGKTRDEMKPKYRACKPKCVSATYRLQTTLQSLFKFNHKPVQC